MDVRIIDAHSSMPNKFGVVIVEDSQTYLGLIVVRRGPSVICCYEGLTLEQFERLSRNSEAAQTLSFIGLSSPSIAVNRQITDMLMCGQPEYFAGTHIRFDEALCNIESFKHMAGELHGKVKELLKCN